ncbi:Uncharacterised protein [Bacillus cereus]|nr:Uncharacterised protein [Bacillus cereus]
MLTSSKSLNTVLDFYLYILLFVKTVFRAKLICDFFILFYATEAEVKRRLSPSGLNKISVEVSN